MSRWRAAGLHLILSMLLGLGVGAVLLLVWYPSPYFSAGGADRLIYLLIGIDIAIGPLLTLAVFKSGKPSLKFDLSVIAILQLSALAYGLMVICQSRPVFIVAAIDRFNVVAANQIEKEDLDKASKAEFKHLSWTGPKLVAARRPEDPRERTELLGAGLAGRDIELKPQYYVSYAEEAKTLLSRARPISELRARASDEEKQRLDNALQQLGKSAEQVGWLPIVARRSDLVMLLDLSDGTPLRALAAAPW